MGSYVLCAQAMGCGQSCCEMSIQLYTRVLPPVALFSENVNYQAAHSTEVDDQIASWELDCSFEFVYLASCRAELLALRSLRSGARSLAASRCFMGTALQYMDRSGICISTKTPQVQLQA